MICEEASCFYELLDEIKNTSSSPLSVTELIDEFEGVNTVYIYANNMKTIRDFKPKYWRIIQKIAKNES